VARATVLLGHYATLHSHAKPPPHFASPGLATQALIRAGKTSYTAGTLYAIFSEIIGNNGNGGVHAAVKNVSETVVVENKFSPKKLRAEYFSKYFPYDDELAKIVDMKQNTKLKKTEQSHDFLKKPMWQNMYIYLVEYLLAFSREWFKKHNFTVLDWGCGKCHVSYLLKKRKIDVVSCDIETTEHADSAFGQYIPIAEFANINVIPLRHEYILPFPDKSFDVVLSFGVLEHASNDKQSLIEINRILKPNGLFFCFWLPYKYSWKQRREYLKGNHYHDRLYDINKVKYLLDGTQFNLIDYWYRDLLPKRYAPLFYRKIEKVDNWFCGNTLLKYFASNIEFVANKTDENRTAAIRGGG
jgi:SAM-dependent methyltransferase